MRDKFSLALCEYLSLFPNFSRKQVIPIPTIYTTRSTTVTSHVPRILRIPQNPQPTDPSKHNLEPKTNKPPGLSWQIFRPPLKIHLLINNTLANIWLNAPADLERSGRYPIEPVQSTPRPSWLLEIWLSSNASATTSPMEGKNHPRAFVDALEVGWAKLNHNRGTFCPRNGPLVAIWLFAVFAAVLAGHYRRRDIMRVYCCWGGFVRSPSWTLKCDKSLGEGGKFVILAGFCFVYRWSICGNAVFDLYTSFAGGGDVTAMHAVDVACVKSRIFLTRFRTTA